ncbi:hypothetical protein D3C72_1804040 [compost metagenome]
MFTLVAGNESDLIEGTMNVAADGHAHALGALWQARWPWIVLFVAVVLAAAAWGVRRRNIHKKN